MIPEINGLVLVGGKSRRMKTDKGLISLYGKPQRIHTYDLLKNAGIRSVYFSCREDQVETLKDYSLLIDKPSFKGPFDVILNIFEEFPDFAWLITACDLPLLTSETIKELLEHRNPSKIATAFQLPENDFPEPLITIWEPSAATNLKRFLEAGNHRLIDFLKQSNVEIITPNNPESLFNMNDPQARLMIEQKLGRGLNRF